MSWFKQSRERFKQSTKARAKEARFQRLLALHGSDTPPTELQQKPPRKVRLTADGVVGGLSCLLGIALPFLAWAGYSHLISRAKASDQLFERTERAKIERIQNPDTSRRWEDWLQQEAKSRDQQISMSSRILWKMVAISALYPVLSLTALMTELRHMRLLRTGILGRGTIIRTAKIWRRGIVRFSDAGGNEFRFKCLIGFAEGSPVWLLYLPNHPQTAGLYSPRRKPLLRIV
ncbi:MAG TPA: hypothetical protein VMV72_06935 [Verrucomicrobiae bacterium]|nr:hypothetical protein [Verrucomicrobiae bacterium]